jgi:hypothetical protein
MLASCGLSLLIGLSDIDDTSSHTLFLITIQKLRHVASEACLAWRVGRVFSAESRYCIRQPASGTHTLFLTVTLGLSIGLTKCRCLSTCSYCCLLSPCVIEPAAGIGLLFCLSRHALCLYAWLLRYWWRVCSEFQYTEMRTRFFFAPSTDARAL